MKVSPRLDPTESFDDGQYSYESSPGRVAAKSDLGKCKAGQRRGILRVGGFGCRSGQTGNRINQRDDAIVVMAGLSAQVDEFKLNAVITCLGGGIGRHTRLKICCSYERVGSSPTRGTHSPKTSRGRLISRPGLMHLAEETII